MKEQISSRIKDIKANIPNTVQLVAVSKTKPIEYIKYAYACNQRIFGENKVQELVEKHEALPKDIEWHMIGHLQTNKVKYIAPFVHLIHSVDSLKIAKEINKRAKQNERVINCLLQVHIAKEESKFGFTIEQTKDFVANNLKDYPNINFVGLMAMATFTTDEDVNKKEFKQMQELFSFVNKQNTNFSILSMGMSGDYKLAIQYNSTMIRLGSTIFGSR